MFYEIDMILLLELKSSFDFDDKPLLQQRLTS